jgi:hypothetical protein
MSAIAVAAITVEAIMAVAITVDAMVIPGGATLMLMLILFLILMLILILILTFILILSPSTTAGVGVFGKGVVVAAKARFDCAGTSRHGFGGGGAAGAATTLSNALSASESPCAPGQCASSRKAEARAFAEGLWSGKKTELGNRSINACST